MTAPASLPVIGRQIYRVRAFDLDPAGRASPAALCNLLQESASVHAHELGVAPVQLQLQGMTWVLSRLHLEVNRYPRWREAVIVETWPAELAPPFAIRDFRVYDEDHREIAVASTWWLLLDLAQRRPLRRIPPAIAALHPRVPVRAFDGDPPRIPAFGAGAASRRFRMRLADLDFNDHVNHVVYIAQVIESAPSELWSAFQVAELQVEYRAECGLGDEIEAFARPVEEPAGSSFLHSLVRVGDGREVARARTRWVAGV